MDPARSEALTWEEFTEEVYNKYVPMSYRRAKVVEFHTLKQGNMTVTEYDRALCEMTRYAPELVDTDEKMAAKFRSGLRPKIRVALASRRGIPYSEVLGCALDVEEALPKNERTTNPAPIGGIRCYACGGNGHTSRECPNNNKGGVKNGQGQRPPQQPQPIRQVAPQQARAYALRGNQGQEPQAIKGKENLAGMGKLQQLPIIVLFDTDASHSFISMSCVNALDSLLLILNRN
ncbi:uncharacterized protein LOC121754460 [Salvia splendens]|uniref:uncharacterized protein LOC121754460 n=1 Tax=Salvia splendens TaxID=180675 RepID=UPI001C26AEDC|nr:uncharacterized protein LOC121754460 [Salvia splendens]